MDGAAIGSERPIGVFDSGVGGLSVLRALREGKDEVFVREDVAAKARQSVERMIAIGNPGSGE